MVLSKLRQTDKAKLSLVPSYLLRKLSQQRHTACEFINLFLGAADGNAKILQGAFGNVAHLLGKLVIGLAALGQIGEVHNSQIMEIRLVQLFPDLFDERPRTPQNRHRKLDTVRSILKNEKYCGDALMQKTYTKDFRTHKSVKNTDLNIYFKENHHVAIIKKEDWLKVQEILAVRRDTKKVAALRRLVNRFVVSRVKDGIFKGYFIMDSRWSAAERREFLTIIEEALN